MLLVAKSMLTPHACQSEGAPVWLSDHLAFGILVLVPHAGRLSPVVATTGSPLLVAEGNPHACESGRNPESGARQESVTHQTKHAKSNGRRFVICSDVFLLFFDKEFSTNLQFFRQRI